MPAGSSWPICSAADLALLASRRAAEVVGPLQTARRAGALGEHGDGLAFRHELIRRALYEDMPLTVRRALHADFARALAAAGEPPEGAAERLLRAAAPNDEAEVIGQSAREVEEIGTREAYDSCPHLILGLQLARLDRLDEAYAALQRGRRASETLGMVDILASFHYELALVDLLRGRLDEVRQVSPNCVKPDLP